jgi:hypothetical protein
VWLMVVCDRIQRACCKCPMMWREEADFPRSGAVGLQPRDNAAYFKSISRTTTVPRRDPKTVSVGTRSSISTGPPCASCLECQLGWNSFVLALAKL